jgi:hypothetical protein
MIIGTPSPRGNQHQLEVVGLPCERARRRVGAEGIGPTSSLPESAGCSRRAATPILKLSARRREPRCPFGQMMRSERRCVLFNPGKMIITERFRGRTLRERIR